ncbi:MAG: HAD family phosphatase [Planctomycetota bacterium]|nr:HAD family phosphatase [Planctomycetota bacterium]
MSTSIRAILFDMDGLLIDTEDIHLRAFAQAATRMGYPSEAKDYLSWIGHSSMALGKWIAERATQKQSPEAIVQLEQEIFLRILFEERPAPLPGAREMIDHCDAAGFKRGLVSSTVYPQVVLTMEVVLAHLGRPARLEETFATVTSGDRVPRMKPAPDPYRQAAGELALDPAHCLVFEDSPAGIASARAAGCRVVAIPNLYLKREEVGKEADASFNTLADAFAARIWERF